MRFAEQGKLHWSYGSGSSSEESVVPRNETIDVDQFALEITGRIRALSDASVPNVRTIRRDISMRIARAELQQVIALALRLSNEFGLRSVAYELVHHHKAALRSLDVGALEWFGRGIDGWKSVDAFALYLAGPAWREHQAPDSLISTWALSKDRWWRRASLVSTVALNNKARGGSGDSSRTIAVCRMLADDRDDMVVKGLSWALRELVRRDPDAVGQFLDESADILAARVKREVRNKLDTGLKNPSRYSRHLD